MHYSVIIIGAGMAGVKTASDLHKAGESNTLILEARDRLGGRLKSQPATLDPSVSYDFGASWFHDGLKNPLFEKAKKLGNVEYFYDDGKYVYVSEDCKDIPSWDFERIVEDIETFGRLYFEGDTHKDDISVRDMCSLYIETHKRELTPEQIRYASQVVRMWLEMWDGISWELASAKHSFLWGVDHLGRNAYVKNGYTTVFKNELDELPELYRKKNIRLSTQVSHINYEGDKLVTITTNKGAVYTADYVVVTTPLSVLRITDESDTHFLKWTPELPGKIRQFLPECEYGSLGKVVFEFDQCFWPEDVQRFYVLASGLESGSTIEPWKNPTLIVNYFAVSGVPSLVFLTQSPVSKYIESLSSKEIWALFKPVVEQIATAPISEPFNVLRTEWNSDPMTRGSYSAGRLNTRMTNEGCDIMAAGASKRVRFAGAETIGGSSNGCAHGAWFSGEREAKYILQQMKVSSKL